jgi:hypothetical protein
MKADSKVRWFSRRAFLGGAGAMVVLPALQSLMPRETWAQALPQPKRFLAWFFPNGVPSMNDWRPTGTGADWQTSLLLSGLEPIKQHVSVVSGLRNRGQGPDHTFGTGAFLTGRLIVDDESLGGPSIDQVIADGLQANGEGAPIHSLQLGIPDHVCEPNVVCFPANNITYNDQGLPITKQTNASDAFNSLFDGFQPSDDAAEAAAAERLARRKSVLDTVLADVARLKPALSATDRVRLEEYLESVRRTEQAITGLEGAKISCVPPDAIVWPEQLDARIDAHIDVMSLAFECDLTRVISFMQASGASGLSRDFPNYHLSITHRADADWQRKFRETVAWEVQKFARLVERLSTKTEADGVTPMLDNAALFFSTDVSDGNSHNHNDMPVLLAGGLGGAITPGQHRVFESGEWFSDLFMHIASGMGIPLDSFGLDGQGRITSL